MLNENLKYLNALNLIKCLGPRRLTKLLNYFNLPQNAWQASVSELSQAGLEENIIQEISASRANINPDQEWQKLQKENISLVSLQDEIYPSLLKEIYDPPVLLYGRGDLSLLSDKWKISVIGTRKPSSYGRQVAEELTANLAAAGLTIVSGLAYGIDALAHQIALQNNGRTISIIGSGLDWTNFYPSHHRALAQQMIKARGLILSEYPLGMPPLKQNFPMRNRVISGLSLGTLVIEAAEKSGTLITANCALDQNREVFAIPGSIYQTSSAGTNWLIKKGAKLVTTINDILEELNIEFSPSSTVNPAAEFDAKSAAYPEESLILSVLSKNPLHVDKIINLTHLDTAIVSATLSLMEIKGLIKNLNGMNYIRT